MTTEIEPDQLDEVEVLAAIFAYDGNLTRAAKQLKVFPTRLRLYVHAKPILREAMAEVMDQGVDEAIGVLWEGLRDKMSYQNRFYAAKQFLTSEAGRRRGFGRDPGVAAQIELKTGDTKPATLQLRWLEPGETPKTIEGEAE
jgi:hypothetical protein